MTATTTASPTQQSSIWWLFLLQGIAAIILALMLLTAPGQTLLVMVTFLGFYWLIEGILSLVRAGALDMSESTKRISKDLIVLMPVYEDRKSATAEAVMACATGHAA